ncbi:MAG: hypothetical protein IJ757_00300 [Clostridiales bacterium]|nr:hypothetical protein [Clostridiales bacterium]
MKIRKLISSVLAVAMIASLSGCAFFDKDDEAVLAVAEDYAAAVAAVEVDDIVDLLVDGDDFEDQIDSLVTGAVDQPVLDEFDDICAAIADTIEYEIDEESVESSKKNAEGSVSITYTIVDYQAIYDQVKEDGGDADDFIDAIDDGDTFEISQTINLVLEDGEWLVSDKKLKNLNAVYSFFSDAVDYSFTSPLLQYIDYLKWWYSDDDVYTNVNEIELDIIPTAAGESVTFNFYYEYYLDGELIYTSDEWQDQGSWIESYYGTWYDDNAAVDEHGYLVPGEYRCIVYDLTGNVLADSTCTVVVEAGDASPEFVDHTEWYYSDDGVYVDYSQIELDIIPTSGIGQSMTWDFYYEYYIDGELVFTSDPCTDSGYWIEAYYGPWYDDNAQLNDDGNLIEGEYTCIIYSLDGQVVAESTCQVVNE